MSLINVFISFTEKILSFKILEIPISSYLITFTILIFVYKFESFLICKYSLKISLYAFILYFF